MVKKDKLITLVICLIFFCWTSLPTGLNINFAINISNTMFRFNIWISILLFIVLSLNVRKSYKKESYYKIYSVFVVYCAINTILHLLFQNYIYFSTGVDAILTVILPMLLLKYFNMISNQSDRRRIIFVLKIIGLYLVAQFFFTKSIAAFRMWDESSNLSRTSTTLGESNCTAYFLLGITLLTFIEYLNYKKKTDALVMTLMVVSIFLSQSRGAIGLLLLYFAVIIFLGDRKGKMRLLLFALALMVGIYFIKPDIYYNIYLRAFTNQSINSDVSREIYRNVALAEFAKRPITGSGLGLLVYRLSRNVRYITDIPNPHNQWASLLSETGLIGTVVFVIAQISIIKRNINKNKNSRIVVICFALYLVFGFMFEAMYTAEIRASLCFWIYWFMIEYFKVAGGK